MSNLITIIAAIVDTSKLTLYLEDGSTLLIPQGDPRLQRCLDVALLHLKKLGDTAVVDISEENHLANYEEKSGGLIKLFRVAKSKVKEFFAKTEAAVVAPITLGIIPSAKDVPAMTATVTKRPQRDEHGEIVTPLVSAVAEIMQHATPVKSPAYTPVVEVLDADKGEETSYEDGDTVIAVVDGNVIPDVQALAPQFAHAAQTNTVGMDNFLKRLGKVMGKRRHSVEDLLKFMRRGDLPVADDGSIVIYKILRKHRTLADTFVDCHSGNVPQKVGSYVHMDEAMVDGNRKVDCSNGLHVARRGYLGSFSGDVCVLAKVAPEDVIAVPDYDSNKMRVCGYHILALLSPDAFSKLKSNRPMTDNSADQLLLGRVLAGDHIGILERVKINGPKGSDIVITPVTAVPGMTPGVPAAKPMARKAEALNYNGNVAPTVDVKAVAKAVTKQKGELYKAPPAGMNVTGPALGEATTPPAPAEDKPVKKIGLKASADTLYQLVLSSTLSDTKQLYAAELVKFKKEKKKSWTDLGLSDVIGASLLEIAADKLPQKGSIFATPETLAKAEKKVLKSQNWPAPTDTSGLAETTPQVIVSDELHDAVSGFQDTGKPTKALKKLMEPKPILLVSVAIQPVSGTAKDGSPRHQIGVLLRQPPTTELADQIIKIKKAAKKSWDALGVTPTEVSNILQLASKK